MSQDREEVRLGDYVELTAHRMGMVKYVGDIHGKKGTYYGVELWKGDGKHSGTYEGHEYFECINKGMGVFVVPKAILYILDVPKDYDPFQKLQEKKRAQQKKKHSSNKYGAPFDENKALKLSNNQSRHRSSSKSSKTPKTKRTNQKQQKLQMKQPQAVRSKYDEKGSLTKNISFALRDASESVMSVAEFKSISLKEYIGKGDNFDIAKRICKFYDELFNDTDTVCLVANIGLKPIYSFSIEGSYKRVETFTREGKYVLVYRAKPHVDTKVIVNKQCYKSVVKGLSIDHDDASQVVDHLNALFGAGCHVVRCKKVSFDIYSRFSDGYECELRLPNGGDYVLAWRR